MDKLHRCWQQKQYRISLDTRLQKWDPWKNKQTKTKFEKYSTCNTNYMDSFDRRANRQMTPL